MFEVCQLSCVRDEIVLFEGLSFVVSEGQMVQVEGKNGAGKTSLLRLLCGLSTPAAGDILFNGISTSRQRDEFNRNMLYIGHHSGIKSVLTAFENLKFYFPAHQDDAIFDALEKVALVGYEELPVAQMSAGQQRRVALAKLYLSDAKLWILDEPLTAIDTIGVAQLTCLFERHCDQGGMIIFTTHQALTGLSREISKVSLISTEAF